ncbi:MAG TPA: hypothetical protein DHW71_07345 [Gammaproteobacteria bacterium]|nr:hypothetical protein [Gammaproteobacteria bacterium]HBF10151.1 hypothetical protein [Gammaproteobacteria bacterium]HCK92783.1 hypothetical protein [Gammaproteobacteria bacterium]|tara:strand:+ start:93 stop:656 length:564 start_codon:yes stop_codon:yes gene_type:complete
MKKLINDDYYAHITKFCGDKPSKLFKDSALKVGVAVFENVPFDGVDSYITIGLSGHKLSQKSGRHIRQEILMTVDRSNAFIEIEKTLFSVTSLIVNTHQALSRGQVLGPWGPVFKSEYQNITSLLCVSPAFFDDDFIFLDVSGETSAIVEVLPITTREAYYIKHEGWEKFFDDVNEGGIDILDYNRP